MKKLIDKRHIWAVLHGRTEVTGITFTGQAIPLFDQILEAL